MKKCYLIIIIIMLCTAGTANAEKYAQMRFDKSIKFMKDLGIKSLVVTEFEYEFGVPQRLGKKIEEITFNENFQITESILFDDGEVDGKITNSYNSNGDTIATIKYGVEGEELKKTEFIYNEAGKLIEKNYYEGKGLMMKDVFSYNDKGLKSEIKNYERDKLIYTLNYVYDNNSREIEWSRLDDEGKMELKSMINYNEKGLKTDSTFFFEGSVDAKFNFKYDNFGRMTNYTVFTGDGKLYSKSEYKFNVDGLLLEERNYDAYNVLLELYLLEYEKDGQVKQILKHGEGEFLEDVSRYKYYDNHLIKHEQLLNNIEVPKFVRKYTYTPAQE